MYQVCEWMSAVAAENARTFPLPAGELDRRVGVLREMGRGFRNMNGHQFREVMTTAHFTDYFSDAISRAFYRQYEYRTGQWQAYVYPDTTPDFRDVKRHRMLKARAMNKRREKGTHKASYLIPSMIDYGVDEFSEEFSVSWRAIMNDDLGAIAEVPQMMFRTTQEWLDDFVSALYDNATTQAALVALGALYAGTGRLTEANLTVGINAMIQRTDATGRPMNIQSVHLVIPPVLQIQAAKVLESAQVAGSADNDKNVIPRFIRGVHVDPYISFSGADIPWYLVADPSEIPTITLARLRDWPGPVVAMQRSDIEVVTGSAPGAFLMGNFESGDIVYMVEDVVGGWDDASYVGVTDYRGIYYSSGTTP